MLSASLCKSLQFDHLYLKLHNKNRRNSTRKSCIKFSLGPVKKCFIWLKFFGGRKTRILHAIAANKQANSHNLNHEFTNHEFTYNYFPCHLLTEQGYPSYINHRWKWIILPERSLNVFKEKCKDSHRTWVRLPNQCRFLKSVHALFFLTRSVNAGCQIVTNNCKKNFKICLEAFKITFSITQIKNMSVKPLSLICITSILNTIYSLKSCSVYGGSCRN